jgi:hypothetical protein
MEPRLNATITWQGVTHQIADILLDRKGEIIRVDTMPVEKDGPFYTFRREALGEADIDIQIETA